MSVEAPLPPLLAEEIRQLRTHAPRLLHWCQHEAWAPWRRVLWCAVPVWLVLAFAALALGWPAPTLVVVVQLDCLGIVLAEILRRSLGGDLLRPWQQMRGTAAGVNDFLNNATMGVQYFLNSPGRIHRNSDQDDQTALVVAILIAVLLAIPWRLAFGEPGTGAGLAGALLLGGLALLARLAYAGWSLRQARSRPPPGGLESHALGVLLALPVLLLPTTFGQGALAIVEGLADSPVSLTSPLAQALLVPVLLALAMAAALLVVRVQQGLRLQRLLRWTQTPQRLDEFEQRAVALFAQAQEMMKTSPLGVARPPKQALLRLLEESDLQTVRERGPQVLAHLRAGENDSLAQLGVGAILAGLLPLICLLVLDWPPISVLALILADWIGLLLADAMVLGWAGSAVQAHHRRQAAVTVVDRVLVALSGSGQLVTAAGWHQNEHGMRVVAFVLTCCLFLTFTPIMLMMVLYLVSGADTDDPSVGWSWLGDLLPLPAGLAAFVVLSLAIRIGAAWLGIAASRRAGPEQGGIALQSLHLLLAPIGLLLVVAIAATIEIPGASAGLLIVAVILLFRIAVGLGLIGFDQARRQRLKTFLGQSPAEHSRRRQVAVAGEWELPALD